LARLGAHHGRQRKMLNPVFGVNHMRHTMTPIFHRSLAAPTRRGLSLRSFVKISIVSDGPQGIADWIDRFALELLGEVGLGYPFGTL
ncbi:hypothetical protein EDB86DRAFT_2767326, partial [Lactarius hatsudake]